MGIPPRDPPPHQEKADSAPGVAGEVASTAVPMDGPHDSSPAGRPAHADWQHDSCGVVAASGHFEISALATVTAPVQRPEAESEDFARS